MAQFLCAAFLCSLMVSIAFPKSTLGADADHTLFHNQTIAFGQNLVSEDQVFELGFFHPGKSTNIFLGIWYKSTPDTIVWVANRNDPITVSQGLGVALAISENGTLAISSGGVVFWSAKPSTAASRPRVRLLDTGNLVLAAAAADGGGYLWQSFDHPTDTWLPEMTLVDDADAGGVERFLTSWRNADDPSVGEFSYKIENQGLPQLMVFKGKIKTFRTGKFNGLYFSGIASFPNLICKPKLVFREERLISVMIRPYENSVIAITKVSISGSIQRFTMNARRESWIPVYSYPRDQCDEYGHCGYNAICAIENAQRCSCFRGFSPKFQDDWDRQDWSGGCSRIAGWKCESGDGFAEVRGVKHPDMLRYWLNNSMTLEECKAECLRNCSCTACANPYISNGGSGCLMWYGDLLDTRKFHGADDKQNIYIRSPASELDFGTSLEEEEEEKRPIKIILISIAAGILVSSFINGGLLLLKKRKKRALKRKDENIDLPFIKMTTILEATNNFSSENMIGKGGFGPVFMGTLSAGEEIAVKRLSRSSGQGLEEFKNEVVLIAKLQHRNLVRLLGYCIEGEERVLIYEYLPNKSLDYFISGATADMDGRKLLTWPKRYDIIMGIARGLLYLHHDSRLKIIHRDLKMSNILLDGNLNPKISDFGLARTFEDDQSVSRTRRVVGTYGYMAPEYAIDGKFSVKSDVFSLGVVLLEIISGKTNRGFQHDDHHHSLLGHAWLLWKEKRMLEVMDECLNDTTYMESQVKRCIHVGLLCVQQFVQDRPLMSSVVMMLASDGAILAEPNEPGYFMERSFSSPALQIKSDNNSLPITDLEAR